MIEILLGLKKDDNRKSCLMMAIRSARYLSGRDVRTGKADGIGEMEANVLMKDDVLAHWLEDEHSIEMVRDIDRSELVSPNLVISPVLGSIPVTRLSGGVKTLIQIEHDRKHVYN